MGELGAKGASIHHIFALSKKDGPKSQKLSK